MSHTARSLIMQMAAAGLPFASLAIPPSVTAQRVYLYSEPTVCVTPFRPISGITFHAGGQFPVVWYLPSPTPGPIDYTGVPDPVTSLDAAKKWSEPKANVTCFLEWYQLAPTPQREVEYRWHINFYGGNVTSCVGMEGHADISPYAGEYDPYDPNTSNQPGAGDGCTDSGGGGGDWDGGGDGTGDNETIGVIPGSGDGGGRSMCPDNAPYYWDIDCIDIYVEGEGWVEYWCGAVMVCG